MTYTFDDVAATLDRIQPYDWRGFLTRRLTETGEHAPLAGFQDNGYRLVYTDTPTAYFKAVEGARKVTDLSYGPGLSLNDKGDVTQVIWDGPAYRAGLTNGATIVSVDGLAYSAERLKAAVTAAKGGSAPIQLLVKTQDSIVPIAIDYHGGLRYPRLEKTAAGEAGLDRLLAAK